MSETECTHRNHSINTMIHTGLGAESTNYRLKYSALPILPFFWLVMEAPPSRISGSPARDYSSSPSLQLCGHVTEFSEASSKEVPNFWIPGLEGKKVLALHISPLPADDSWSRQRRNHMSRIAEALQKPQAAHLSLLHEKASTICLTQAAALQALFVTAV